MGDTDQETGGAVQASTLEIKAEGLGFTSRGDFAKFSKYASSVIAKTISVGESQSLEPEELDPFENNQDVIDPPIPLSLFIDVWKISPSLMPSIGAMVTNIDSHGHAFIPTINLDSEKALQAVKDSIYLEWLWRQENLPENLGKDFVEPSDEEVEKRIAELKKEARREEMRLKILFNHGTSGGSFTQLRRIVRQDVEVTGNGYIEIVRSPNGQIGRLKRVASEYMRIAKLEKTARVVDCPIKISPIHWDTLPDRRRYRRYVQWAAYRDFVWFKEFGDDRIMSNGSGVYYDSVEKMKEAEGEKVKPANEVIHLKAVASPDSPYGMPRWIGAMLEAMGEQAAGQVNLLYFDHKAIPAGMLLVSGGFLDPDAEEEIKKFFQGQIKGRKNFHKVLVVSAIPKQISPVSGSTMNVGIKWQPMRDDAHSDAQFLKYMERCQRIVGQSFRLAPLLRGDTRDFNRATSQAAMKHGEEQVFQPERGVFDDTMDSTVLTDMRIRFWQFRSNSPLARDPQILARIIALMVHRGVLSLDEGRELASDVFSKDFPLYSKSWSTLPLKMVLAGLKAGGDAEADSDPRGSDRESFDSYERDLMGDDEDDQDAGGAVLKTTEELFDELLKRAAQQ